MENVLFKKKKIYDFPKVEKFAFSIQSVGDRFSHNFDFAIAD